MRRRFPPKSRRTFPARFAERKRELETELESAKTTFVELNSARFRRRVELSQQERAIFSDSRYSRGFRSWFAAGENRLNDQGKAALSQVREQYRLLSDPSSDEDAARQTWKTLEHQLLALSQEAHRAVGAERAAKEARRKALRDAYMGRIREGADSVKASMSQSHHCPYCDGPLGDAPEADHIHPVCRGGLSLEDNLVWVCRNCNQKKSDLTLGQFIDRYGLNRDRVFDALRKLGKAY